MAVGNVSVPFLSFQSFVTEVAEPQRLEARSTPAGRSPFVSVYELEEAENSYDPLREAYSSLVDELHDEEFEEALFEVVSDARVLHRSHLAAGNSGADADRIVTQHFARLTREAEGALDVIQREFGARDEATLGESEVETFFEAFAPSSAEPSFENFLGKLVKKVGGAMKKVAGKALQGIKKFGLGFVLGKLRALMQPFLQRVLLKVIGKLPVAVRPAARTLAGKLGLPLPPEPSAPAAPLPAARAPSDAAAPAVTDAAAPNPAPPVETAGAPVQAPAGPDVAALSQEFDQQLAQALLGQDEAELELEVLREARDASQAVPVFAELDEARERLIRELSELKSGESAQPQLENFLPAALPVLKLGMSLLGRPKVVGFLADILSKLIAKLIGPEQAPALSRALVDSGLRLLSLEMSEADEARLGPAAVVATVEETLTRVASLPPHVLDNQELLEAFTLEAFEQAAAANLPAVLSEAVYEQRPELLEAGVDAGWIALPLRGRKRYKRCSKTFTVKVTPHIANELETFEGASLAEVLHEQLGLPEGAEVEAEVHLYEVLPGTLASDISAHESESIGLGSADEATVSQLHPLSEAAASTLLGKPGLGRAVPVASNRRALAVGQRLFHLAIPGVRPLSVMARGGRRHVRRLARVSVVLDAAQDQIRVKLFLSEVKAQKLAVRLRQQVHAGSLGVGFHKFMQRRLAAIAAGKFPERLRLVHAGAANGQPAQPGLTALPPPVANAVVSKLLEWLSHGYADFVKNQSAQFLKAVEDPADGVTLRFVIEHPAGLAQLVPALLAKGAPAASLTGLFANASRPNVRCEVLPGHRRG
ncbi:MAG: hypothetical protein QM756_34995 [Polyangiaceae bacterium]